MLLGAELYLFAREPDPGPRAMAATAAAAAAAWAPARPAQRREGGGRLGPGSLH